MRSNPWQSYANRTADSVIPPTRARRDSLTRLGLIVAALVAISYGPSVVDLVQHREPGDVAVAFASLVGLLIAVVPIIASSAAWPAQRGTGPHAGLLTARTLTGWRTVDLDRLTAIRYRQVNRLRPALDYLIVTDANRVRLGIRANDQAAIDWLREAVQSTHADVRVSRSAATALGLSAKEASGYRRCWDEFTMLYGLVFWAATVAVYALIISLLVSNS